MKVTSQLKYSLLFIGLGLSWGVTAQNGELLLLNGKKVTISQYNLDTTDLFNSKIYYTNIKGRQKSKYLDDVFSVTLKNEEERVFYQTNPAEGDILTPEQMKDYVMGQHIALKNYNEPWTALLGGITGFAGVMLPGIPVDNSNFNGEVPVGIVVPALYVVGVGSVTPDESVVKKQVESKYANNEYYIMGCQEGIRKKRIKNSAIGVGIGIVAGFVTLAVVN